MAIATITTAIQTIAGALSGIRNAPSNPPDQVGAFPFAVTYPERGAFTAGSLTKALTAGQHVIVTEIHVARKDLPRAVAGAIGYADLFHTALQADPTLGGSVLIIDSLTWEFGPLVWGAVETIGYRLRLTVTEDKC